MQLTAYFLTKSHDKHTHTHLAQVVLAHLVALESVLIPALLLTQLAVPTQALQALGLDPVADLCL